MLKEKNEITTLKQQLEDSIKEQQQTNKELREEMRKEISEKTPRLANEIVEEDPDDEQ